MIVWQKSYKLSLQIYRITKDFPKEEIYGIVSQLRRSVVSIPSNIAEGYGRNNKNEYVRFLQIAFASGAELETQLMLSRDLSYLKQKKFDEIYDLLQEIMKMLNVLIKRLKTKSH